MLLLRLLRSLSFLLFCSRVMVLFPKLCTSLLLPLVRVRHTLRSCLSPRRNGTGTQFLTHRRHKGLKFEMELREDGSFDLSGFSPHLLTFLPATNCLLATDRSGGARCLDLTSGVELFSAGNTPYHNNSTPTNTVLIHILNCAHVNTCNISLL